MRQPVSSEHSAELRDAEAAAEASCVAAAGSLDDGGSICRFCLDGASAASNPLVAPCRCRGTARHVHEHCLSRWRAVGRAERTFSTCLECGAPYKLRLRHAAGAAALGLWRTRALDVLLRDFVPCFLLLQLCLVGLACALAAADPGRQAYRALGGYTCRATVLVPPSQSFGGADDGSDDLDVDRAQAAAIEALRRACTREFYYIAAFVLAIAMTAVAAGVAALVTLFRDAEAHYNTSRGYAAKKQAAPPAEPPAPRCLSIEARDVCVCGVLVLSGLMVGGYVGAILALTAAVLRAAQLRALAWQRWRLVDAYAVVDGAYAPAGLGCERAHMLPDQHRDYLRALGFLPPGGA